MTENRTMNGRNGRGFTLTEMLVVLGIMGIFLGISVPVLVSFMRQNEMERASSVVSIAVVRTRTMAIETREKYTLVLDQTGNRLWIGPEAGVNEVLAGTKTLPEVIVDDPQYLPEVVRLVRGQFPQTITFAPSGGLTTGTNMDGFYLVGASLYEGTASGGGATSLTVAGAPWQDNRYRESFVIIMSPGSVIAGQARRITSNTGNSLTIDPAWEGGSPSNGTAFAIVDPSQLRNVVIYSTTGQARITTP